MRFIIETIYTLFVLLIIARVILSWINLDYYHPVRRTVMNLTEPLLAPIRQMLPATGGLDFSPFILLILAYLVRAVLLSIF